MAAQAFLADRKSQTQSAYTFSFAATHRQIREAQRLRFEIFSQELGADIDSRFQGLDEEHFDPFCDHLLVREAETGRLVATTRLLTQEQSLNAGGFYTESEFDLSRVLCRPGRFLEVGRTCTHPDFRRGASIATLWKGISAVLLGGEYDYLIGCASIPLSHGMGAVHALTEKLLHKHACDPAHQATPRLPLPNMAPPTQPAPMPALLKAYLRLGAEICGPPCWDPDFKTADLMILADRHQFESRYARRFLKAS